MQNKAILMFLILSVFAFAHGQSIPESAKADFSTRFPTASVPRWEKEGKLFEVEFQEGGESASAEYDLKGDWMVTERKISAASLPRKVKDAVTAKFPGSTIVGAESVQDGDAALKYEIFIKLHDGMREVLTTANGKIIRSASEKGSGSESDGEDSEKH